MAGEGGGASFDTGGGGGSGEGAGKGGTDSGVTPGSGAADKGGGDAAPPTTAGSTSTAFAPESPAAPSGGGGFDTSSFNTDFGVPTDVSQMQFSDSGTGAGVGTGVGTDLGTGFSGSGSGPSFSDWTAGIGGGQPFASGGVSSSASPGTSGGPIDVANVPGVSAPSSTGGVGATSLAPATSSVAAAPADATSSWTDFLKLKNPAQTALGAAGLGYNIYQGQQTSANQQAMIDLAQRQTDQNKSLQDRGLQITNQNVENAQGLNKEGAALRQYLATGQLPPEYMSQVDTAIADAKQTAVSNAAKNGQPTDPTKNTALAQQFAQIENQRAGMVSQIAERLAAAGTSLTQIGTGAGTTSASSLVNAGQSAAGLSADLYKTLTGMDAKQSEQTAKAIAALAASLNGGTPQQKAA